MTTQNFNNYKIFNCLEKGIFNFDILKNVLTFTGENQKKLFEIARNKREEKFPGQEVEVRSVIEPIYHNVLSLRGED